MDLGSGTNASVGSLQHPRLSKNYRGLFDGFHTCLPATLVETNLRGFRDKNHSYQKPQNTSRIIAVGDSYTFGWGLNLSQTYHQRLERKLNEGDNTTNYQVLNFGIFGLTSLEKIRLIEEEGLKYNPDLILFQYHSDDLYNRTKLIEDVNDRVETRIEELSKDTDYTKSKIRNNRTLVIRLRIEAMRDLRKEQSQKKVNYTEKREKFLEEPLKELNRKGDFEIYIIPFPPINDRDLNYLNNLAKNRSNITYLPVNEEWKKWKEQWGRSRLILSEEDPHPSSFSNMLLSEYLYDHIYRQQDEGI